MTSRDHKSIECPRKNAQEDNQRYSYDSKARRKRTRSTPLCSMKDQLQITIIQTSGDRDKSHWLFRMGGSRDDSKAEI